MVNLRRRSVSKGSPQNIRPSEQLPKNHRNTQGEMYLGLTVLMVKEGERLDNYTVYSACVYQII